MADDVSVKFGADIAGLKTGVDQIKGQLDRLRGSVSGVSDIFRKGFEIAGIGLSIEAVRRFVETISDLGEQTERMANIFGITTEQVGELRFVADATGGSMEALTRSLERFSLSLAAGEGGDSTVNRAIKALGLDSKALLALPLPDLLDKLREKFSALAPGMDRTRLAQALVRGGAESLLPVLSLSTAQWRELTEAFNATGAKLSGATAAALAETHNKIETMGYAFQGLAVTIFRGFKPAIDAVVEAVTHFVEGLNEAIRQDPVLAGIMSALATAVNFVIAAVLTLATAFVTLWDIASGIIIALKDALLGLADAVMDAITLNFSKIGEDLAFTFDTIAGVAEKSAKKIGDALAFYSKTVWALFNETPTVKSPRGSNKPGGSLGGPSAGDKALEAALQASEKQLASLKAQAEAFHMGTAAAAAYLEEKKLLAVADVNGIKITDELSKKIKTLAAETGAATEKLQHMQQVQDVVSQLGQGIGNAFASWLNGTERLGTAFLKLAAQMAVAVVQALILDAILSALGLAAPTTGLAGLLSGIFKFGGGRAQGGPLESGKWYIAGEHGPEPIWGGGPGAFAAGYGQQTGGQPGGGGLMNRMINNRFGNIVVNNRNGSLTPAMIISALTQAMRDGHRPWNS